MTRHFATRHLMPEDRAMADLVSYLDWDTVRSARIIATASQWVAAVRAHKSSAGEVESFLQRYPLHSREGLALMTLAEALLRIPDSKTADLLIEEKMADAHWVGDSENSSSGQGGWLMKGASFGLSLAQKTLGSVLGGVAKPAVRMAMEEAVRRMGHQFVLGADIESALAQGGARQAKGYRLSFDMLGEGARTYHDSERYFNAYCHAIAAVGKAGDGSVALEKKPGISVKLSALYPRYHYTHAAYCVPAMIEKLLVLAQLAKQHNIAMTIDAEEADRLEISIQIIEAVAAHESLAGWNGLGLAVQAYDKRAFALIDDLEELAKRTKRRLHVRLVKGAYWDTEIKRAQVAGLIDYPVYTRKSHTDISYLACAKKLLSKRDVFYPMFATHNAHSIAAVLDMARDYGAGAFEFQRLHGMGESLHDLIVRDHQVTIYAPVGSYEDLLPYLVRRMLENGANTSFVQKLRDNAVAIEDLVRDPLQDYAVHGGKPHGSIVLPQNIYGESRLNSNGIDLSAADVRHDFDRLIGSMKSRRDYQAMSIINGATVKYTDSISCYSPSDRGDFLGVVWPVPAEKAQRVVDGVMGFAVTGFEEWYGTDVKYRADILHKIADGLEQNAAHYFSLLQREAGKTYHDALNEIREAVDFCRYYAAQGRVQFDAAGIDLSGPTGESNRLVMNGRGVFVCISPWNFPLAIFLGQVVAALMAGNSVIAKPAEQTPLIAYEMVRLMHACGVPQNVLHLLCGDGAVGAALTQHKDVAGVAFTGSIQVAQLIQAALSKRHDVYGVDVALPVLIAETGGQNVMVVDSSALPEQVIDDIMISAFGSAGQRCSACRVVYVQDSIADKIIELLKGALQAWHVGNPALIDTDSGPLIDEEALNNVIEHRKKWSQAVVAEAALSEQLNGFYCAPFVVAIDSISALSREIFGPVVHVVRYDLADVDRVFADINRSGYGLTFGLHSRIEKHIREWPLKIRAGNVYINRSMIGAVVGVHPFGGQGLSGTGPKAGGPHYLARFATEKTITNNITATGGNFSLMMLDDGR